MPIYRFEVEVKLPSGEDAKFATFGIAETEDEMKTKSLANIAESEPGAVITSFHVTETSKQEVEEYLASIKAAYEQKPRH